MSESASTTKSRTWLWWGLAIATLVLGFADLARGGETIAPILLVIGYCVLVPIAILCAIFAAPFVLAAIALG